MNSPQPDMPPGVRAALLDRSQRAGPPLLGLGTNPPVHPNDLRIDGTANEVVLTFALITGGSGEAGQMVQEVARIVMSWPMLESLVQSGANILEQAKGFRVQELRRQLSVLDGNT